jgi:hypothetical protein
MNELLAKTLSYFTPPSTGPEPPETSEITAGCGHEIYPGEFVFVMPSGDTMCEDCLRYAVADLPAPDLAQLLGYDVRYAE